MGLTNLVYCSMTPATVPSAPQGQGRPEHDSGGGGGKGERGEWAEEGGGGFPGHAWASVCGQVGAPAVRIGAAHAARNRAAGGVGGGRVGGGRRRRGGEAAAFTTGG